MRMRQGLSIKKTTINKSIKHTDGPTEVNGEEVLLQHHKSAWSALSLQLEVLVSAPEFSIQVVGFSLQLQLIVPALLSHMSP